MNIPISQSNLASLIEDIVANSGLADEIAERLAGRLQADDKPEHALAILAIPANRLRDGLHAVLFAACPADSTCNTYVGGIHFDLSGTSPAIVASDGYMLARCTLNLCLMADFPSSFTIHRDSAYALSNLIFDLSSPNAFVHITLTEQEASFGLPCNRDTHAYTGDARGDTYICPTTLHKFIDYKRVIPNYSPNTLQANRCELLQAIRTLCAERHNDITCLILAPNEITLTPHDANGSPSAEPHVAPKLFCSYAGEGVKIALSTSGITAILNSFDTPDVLMQFSTDKSPVIFSPYPCESPDLSTIVIIAPKNIDQ
jgi:DNA polymerase III sliding clamp (beta) subunit (PCNA family)